MMWYVTVHNVAKEKCKLYCKNILWGEGDVDGDGEWGRDGDGVRDVQRQTDR